MPNTVVRAAAEGVPNLTRRLFLGRAAAAGATVAVIAPALAETATLMTARERLHYHLEEFKKAAMEVNPRVRFTRLSDHLGDESQSLGLFVMAQWATGQYEGDGLYRGGSEYNCHSTYKVKQMNRPDAPERMFSIKRVGAYPSKRETLTESELDTFIGRRVA